VPVITFLYYCSVRIGEALQIKWEQVDLSRRLVRLEDEQTKTDEAPHSSLAIHLVMTPPAIGASGALLGLKNGDLANGPARVLCFAYSI
jgi:integrase